MNTLKVVIKEGFLGSQIVGVGERRKGFLGVRHKREKGDISAFSAASCARLRRALCVLRPAFDCRICGLCLTIPGAVLQPSYLRQVWHLFRVRVSQKLSVPWVWRIELQKRKQAHFHLVVYGRGFEDAFTLRELWEQVIKSKILDRGIITAREYRDFLRHGVRVDDLSACRSAGVVGYLCDHQSKHKQDQLGWVGRQWGVVNRGLLKVDSKTVFECSVPDWVQIRRQYTRFQRKLKKQGRYYGRRLALARNKDVFSSCIFGLDEIRLSDIICAMKRGGVICKS